ncbi:hypothetical protein J1614_006183 [Plenodomus biglobosus]|nr:hypothetical protein J1614_006183 [Plenodomus biglobosus]
MIAQHSKRPDAKSLERRRTTPQNLDAHPTAFMFIDASNGGVNAKPDKVVRSFVMKSARNRKPWSTKPKSPVSETPIKGRSSQRPLYWPAGSTIPVHTSRYSPVLEYNTSLVPLGLPVIASPSSGSDSVVSCQNNGGACGSPLSNYTSPRDEFDGISFSCDAVQQMNSKYQSNPNIGFAASFDCLAVRLDAYTECLIHQFIEFTIPNLLPIDLHRSSREAATYWVATCLQSPIGAPFIYAALTTSLRAAKHDSEVYKWRAVSAVNKLLANKQYSTDDTTIASVLILLALAESDLAGSRKKGDDLKSSIGANDAHLNGLRTMIEQRGGLAALDGNRCLQVCILMHSIAQSITTLRRPYAVLHDTSGHIEDYSNVSLNPAMKPNHITQQCQALGITGILLEIIHTVTIFISDLTRWYDTSSCLIDSLELQKHASLLMYRIFNWYDRCSQDDTHATDQAVCLALLIFMTHAAEPKAVPLGSRLSKVVAKLHVNLQKIPLSQWSNAQDLHLWTLTMGALGIQSPMNSSRLLNPDPRIVFFMQQFAVAFGTTNMDATFILNTRFAYAFANMKTGSYAAWL